MTSDRLSLIPASYVYLRRGKEVLLQQRANTGYMDGRWVAGAAGHVDPGETARSAAVREAREELGVEIDAEDLRLITVMQRTDGLGTPIEQRVDWFWTVEHWRGEPQVQEPGKCAGIRWAPLEDLPEPMPGYEAFVLDGLRDGHVQLDTSWGFTGHGGEGLAGTV